MLYVNLFSSSALVSVLNNRLLTVISTKLNGPGLTPVKPPIVTAPVVVPPIVPEPVVKEPTAPAPVIPEPTVPPVVAPPQVVVPPVVTEPEPEPAEPEPEPEPEPIQPTVPPPVVSEPTDPEPVVTDPEPEPEVTEPVATEPEPEVSEPEPEVTEPEPEITQPPATPPVFTPPPVVSEPVAPRIVFGGQGNDTLTGTSARDTFVVSKGFGSDTVTGFVAGAGGDYLRVQNYGFSSFTAFKAAARQVQADVVVELSPAETVTLKGVELSAFVAENVQLDFALPGGAAVSNWVLVEKAGGTVSGTAGNDKIMTSLVDVTFAGGAGDDTYEVVDPKTTIIERPGDGIDTVLSWSAEGYRLSNTQSLENLILMGDINAWGMGNDLDNIITGNSAGNVIGGGRGNDILIGGGGRDYFIVAKGEGSDLIADFSVAERDVVRFDGTGFKSFADIKAALTQVGIDTVIDLGGGESLTLRGVAMDALSAESFALEFDMSGMLLTFGDEFDTFSRSTEGVGTWHTRFSFGGNASYTFATEHQAYVDTDFKGMEGYEATKSLGLDPFSIEDGKLVITAEPIEPELKRHFAGQNYTSGVISSESSFWQTYGYFEMSARLPEVAGAWPMFWLLPADKDIPSELDPLEALGDRPDAFHIGAHGEAGEEGQWIPIDGSISDSHVYAVKWTPYELTYYIDNKQVYTYTTPDDMNRAMYLIANMALGSGNFAGTPAPDAVARMSIDYIRAYQLTEYTLENYTLKSSAGPTTTINGTARNDTLTGTAGADLIDGKGGVDRLAGGEGDDTYVVYDSWAVIEELSGQGVDTALSSVSFTLGRYVENLTLTGSANIDATGNTMSNIITGNAGANTIIGGQGNDVLTGGSGKDAFVLQRGDGSDIITDFTPGSDVVRLLDFGFSTFEEVRAGMSVHGKDVYLRLSAYETLVFRDVSIAAFSARDFELPVKPTLSQESIKWYFGTEAEDTFYGTGSNETFIGFGGKDILAGGLGDDIYDAIAGTTIIELPGEGIDTVESWEANYVLPDNIENLIMMFGTGGTGNALANYIHGSDGDDTINGKGGNDWLVGGLGNDTFVIERNNGFDTIEDFTINASGKGDNDVLRFAGYGKDAYLTNNGDVYSIHHTGGVDSFRLIGVTDLSSSNYAFV